MIPEEKIEIVQTACRAIWDQPWPDTMEPVHGGLSGALVYRAEARGQACLLRLDGGRDALRDPHRWHPCMQVAAQAGIAPCVRYANAEAGLTIVDWIEGRFITDAFHGYRARLLSEIGGLVRRLHAGPAFPPLTDYLVGLEQMTMAAMAAGALPPREAKQGRAAVARIIAAYRRLPREDVASHNDLNPRNMLWDGRRIWFVDWEAAFQADRYVDLASVANWFARDGEGQARLLHAYFGAEPTTGQSARLRLAQLLNHIFYGMGLIAFSGEAGDPAAPVRDLVELHQALIEGETVMDSAAGRFEYARARLRAAVEGADPADLENLARTAA